MPSTDEQLREILDVDAVKDLDMIAASLDTTLEDALYATLQHWHETKE